MCCAFQLNVQTIDDIKKRKEEKKNTIRKNVDVSVVNAIHNNTFSRVY